MTGEIVNILEDKGYFFVRGEDGLEYFAHKSALSLCAWSDVIYGQACEFQPVEHHPKGPRAMCVRIQRRQTA